MTAKVIVVIVGLGLTLMSTWPDFKRTPLREKLVYLGLMCFAVYLGIDFLIEANFPQLTKVVNWLFAEPAKYIQASLQSSL